MPESMLKTLAEDFATWLTAQGKAKGAHTFDNKPQGFAKEFIDKKGAGVTEDVLKQRLWWWRSVTEADSHKIFPGAGSTEDPDAFTLFIEYQQQSAFYYELRARIGDRYQWDFGHPWILCSREQREYLASLWPTETTPTIWQPSQKGKPGWVEIPARHINLNANDTGLQRQFVDDLARLRKEHRIPRPGPGKGVLRKPVSFLPIELLDRRYYLGEKLGDSQRSQVSNERRDYAHACKAVGIKP